MPSSPNTDILATAVIIVDAHQVIRYLNPAAENLLGVSAYHALERPVNSMLGDCTELVRALSNALSEGASYTEHDLALTLNGHTLVLSATVSPLDDAHGSAVIELHPAAGNVRIARDEQVMAQTQASQALLRQLAHEIRNPLGGIRGAAQLLEGELESSDLREYTQVIIQETNRLQGLLDRLLTPAKRPVVQPVNIHEVLERVRSLLQAEYPRLQFQCDYDTSLPELAGDPEQLIQAVLNIARNAAQAMNGDGRISFRTRVARQVTLAMKLWKLAIRVDVIDNGPGIPEAIRDTLFYPMITGKEGGTGLGLSIAQNLIASAQGCASTCISWPGRT
jgi:two-component system nitrogen regulation sensor histidine kinase GlnL